MFTLLKSWQSVQYLPKVHPISVRWATKPRWVPIAKTKKFRIRRKHSDPPEKTEEVARLFNNYRTAMKATIAQFKRMYQENETGEEVIEKLERQKEDAWQLALKLNEEWNRQVAVERVQRDKELYEKEVEKALQHMQEVDEKRKKLQEAADALIREQKELSKSFITAENIDAHIEKILSSPPYTFNYAVDLQGNVYDGLSKTPTRSVEDLHSSNPTKPPTEEQEVVGNAG